MRRKIAADTKMALLAAARCLRLVLLVFASAVEISLFSSTPCRYVSGSFIERRGPFCSTNQGNQKHLNNKGRELPPRLRSQRPTTHCRSLLTAPASPAASESGSSSPALHRLEDIRRVYCLSDLHTDHVLNLEWLRERMNCSATTGNSAADDDPAPLGSDDLLVVAGDISHDTETFVETIQVLKQTGCHVMFVPGNHEAWLTKEEREGDASVRLDSIRKLELVCDICRECGVIVDPCLIDDGMNPLVILPIHSWYDGSLSFSESLCKGFEYWPWVDFIRCQWPSQFADDDTESINSRIPKGLVEYYMQSNEPQIELVRDILSNDPTCSMMTISHFLPNVQTLPDWKDANAIEFDKDNWLDHGGAEISAKFAKVAGSSLIDQQIRAIRRSLDSVSPTALDNRGGSSKHIHVFGHSHRPKDFVFDGIRYVHNPLGKPRERQLHLISPSVDFQLLWECCGGGPERDGETRSKSSGSGGGEVQGETIYRYWDEKGGGKEKLWERMEQIRPGRYGRYKYKQRKERISALKATAPGTAAATTSQQAHDVAED